MLADIEHTMHKSAIIGATALFALGILLVGLYFHQTPRITRRIAPQDLSAIKVLVHRTNGRKPILPDFSWNSVRQLPVAICRPRDRILSITTAGDAVQVET